MEGSLSVMVHGGRKADFERKAWISREREKMCCVVTVVHSIDEQSTAIYESQISTSQCQDKATYLKLP